MWNKTIYTYHGMCDLILLDNPDYPSGLGSKMHLRTKIVGDAYSIIQRAVVAIGADIFEVEMDSPTTYYNGVLASLPLSLGGAFQVKLVRTKSVPGGTLYVYEISLGGKDRIIVKSFPQWVDVRIKSLENRKAKFGTSLGMLGSLDGTWYAPNGVTILEDAVSLANKWQVKTEGSTLFTGFGDGPQNQTHVSFRRCMVVPLHIDKIYKKMTIRSNPWQKYIVSRMILDQRTEHPK